MEQTKVTDENRLDFFRTLYTVQNFSKNNLLDISQFKNKKIVAVDSCGFYYEKLFFDIFKIEHVQTVKQFQFAKNMFDKLYNKIENISEKADILILDHCPAIFKYKSEIELKNILETLTSSVSPMHCLVRMNSITLGDNRLTDRFKNLCSIIPETYIVTNLKFSPIELSFQLLKKNEFSIN